MTHRPHSSPAPALPSNTRRSRMSIPNEDLDDDLCMMHKKHKYCQDDNSESGDNPLWRPSSTAMGLWLSKDSFISRLVTKVMATQITPTPALPLHPECREVYTVLEEDEYDAAPLATMMVFDQAVERLNSSANVYIYQRQDFNEPSELLVAWKAGNLWQYEPLVDVVTCLIVWVE